MTKVVGVQVEIVWMCNKCDRSGTLTFSNHSCVGERLRAAREQHLLSSPLCPLDWDDIVVQNSVVLDDEQGKQA